MAIRLIVGGDDLTDKASNLEWSNVDPGGHETCSFEVPNDVFPNPGDTVAVWEGLTRVWMGRVEEPGDNYSERRAPGQVGCVGAGAILKDQDVQVIFRDVDLSRWQGVPLARGLVLVGGSFRVDQYRLMQGVGYHAVQLPIHGPWAAIGKPIAESWYDSGGAPIGYVTGDWERASSNVNPADTNWSWYLTVATDEGATLVDQSANLRAAGPATATITATTDDRRYAYVMFFYASVASSSGLEFAINWTGLAVVGTHGLTIRGTTVATQGFYPEDIAGWAVDQVPGVDRGVIEASGVILGHSVYYTPVPYEQIIADMGVFLGWHWGVWAPDSLLSDTPVLDFRAPAADATVTVGRRDCRQLRLAQQLSTFHNQARVSYTDQAGTTANVLVTRENPRLPAGLPRTLPLDIGKADSTVAESVGEVMLALEEQQTRAAGSVELPAVVGGANGRQPAHLLRAGIDRLKIVGLPGAGPWTETDTRRFDTFRIARTVSRLQPGGAVTTTCELDSGANLQETLNARLALAAARAG